MKIYKFLIVSIIFFTIPVSCVQQNNWPETEKYAFLISCENAYMEAANASQSQSDCYCNETLRLTMNKYPNIDDAENMTVSEIQEMAVKATEKCY